MSDWLTSNEKISRYNDALKRGVTDDATFKRFRRETGVREIIEGLPDVVGHGYHAKLISQVGDEFIRTNWNRIVRNDAVGDPMLVELPPHGKAASTTMRYAWNVVDMDKHGVKLEDVDIVEVGGGYGGLCRMIHEFHKPRSYTIVDLPEALALAKRYLAEFNIKPTLVSCYEYMQRPIDTFISNYALTELTKDVQGGYVNKLMTHAVCGYVTYNSQPHNAGNQWSLNELRHMVPGGSVIEEENVKKSECKVLIWTP